jgi:hypothetical protein
VSAYNSVIVRYILKSFSSIIPSFINIQLFCLVCTKTIEQL